VMTCLATTNLATLIDAWEPLNLLPVVDGDLFPQSPDVAITSDPKFGLVAAIPSFMIAVLNPGTYFAAPFVTPILSYGQDGWRKFLVAKYGATVGNIVADQYSDGIYGKQNEATIFDRVQYFIGDSIWLCPLRRHAGYMTGFNPQVYVGVWNVKATFITSPPTYGIVHGTEVPFIFGNAVDIQIDQPAAFTSQEAKLSNNIIGAIGNFMKTGSPGSSWPRWTPEMHTVINLADFLPLNPMMAIRTPGAGTTALGPQDNRCFMWDYFFNKQTGLTQMDKNVTSNLNIWSHRK